jgi:hypothetical protein
MDKAMLHTEENMVFQQLGASDVNDMESLISKLYTIRRPPEYYAWHCFQGPDPTVVIGLKHQGKLGGVFSIQKRLLNNGLFCGQANHLNIASDWQGKGYFFKLGKKAIRHFDDIEMVCVFANKQARAACESSLGMKTIGVIPTMVLDVNKISVDESVTSTCEPINGKTKFPAFRDSEDILMFKYSSGHRIWRFAKHPMYSYSIVRIDSGEYAVIKKFSDPQTKKSFGDIVDLECPLTNKERLHKVISAASGHLKEQGASMITTWALPNGQVSQVMEDIGFCAGGHETYFCVKALKPERDYLYDFSRWHLRQADATNY